MFMKTHNIIGIVVLYISKISAKNGIANIEKLFIDAKCEGNDMLLQKMDNTWTRFSCSSGETCSSLNGKVQCVSDKSMIKISTVTITLPSNIEPTVTIKHPSTNNRFNSDSGSKSSSNQNNAVQITDSSQGMASSNQGTLTQSDTPGGSGSNKNGSNTNSEGKQSSGMNTNQSEKSTTSTTDSGRVKSASNDYNTQMGTDSPAQSESAPAVNSIPGSNDQSTNALSPSNSTKNQQSGESTPTEAGNIVIEYKDNGTGNIDFKIPGITKSTKNNDTTEQITPGEFNKTLPTQKDSANGTSQEKTPISPSNPEPISSLSHSTMLSQASSATAAPAANSPAPANTANKTDTKSSSPPASNTKSGDSSNQGAPSTKVSTITADQIKKTLSACGYSGSPKQDFVNELITQINKNNWSDNEKSMFLAQIYHESGGLTMLIEQACINTPCTNYDNANKANGPVAGAPGKHYFGRGYIQLTWPANYKEASNSIYKDDRLYTNPDQVATDKSIAAAVSIWYWNTRVMTSKSPLSNFGETTKAINGAIECQGGPNASAKQRYSNYLAIAKVFGVSPTASSKGCGDN
ncbi:hypothetical protein NEPAR04_2064 [Nematocida parisii]|nr:hypothetical protein NEPAR03_0931 [Nematocida parisii]KAI5130602.1 hypothetical protein NEPAR08_2111 [Nematocida parisii]KAI5144087.1 hypothetical protein NEPAR04_2064 [Nematocida parisii]